MRVDFWGNGRAAAIRRNSVAPRRIGASLLAYSFGVVLQNHQGAPRNLTIIKKPANDPEAADRPDLLGLRDRALIGMMVYSFARIGAVIQMKNSGKLEVAQQIANHESPRTTKLYDRRNDEISLDEIERITI